MTNLFGEYDVAIDSKNRFLLPSGFRKQLAEGMGEKFVINRGFENCLTIWPMNVWEPLAAKVIAINDFNPKVRDFKRIFLNGATIVEVDGADRILIPKGLMEYAGIKKDAVLNSLGNKMELWDKDNFNNYMNQNTPGFSKLAEDMNKDYPNLFDNI